MMLRPEDIERFKMRLLEERAKILKDMEKLVKDSNELGKDGTMDIGDEASDLSNRQLLLSLNEADRKKLMEIDEALERIEEGTYGICEECGEPISIKRLEVKPTAIYCVECKSRLEKFEKREMAT
ncbi:MAG: TraR/DksA family transcriptional regulator [Deltaproteobacteria bacterium]|nr:TraR/DksA family transcriptional regulator [Deltaproteobacteria bacterium]